jgi:hypothetical protein
VFSTFLQSSSLQLPTSRNGLHRLGKRPQGGRVHHGQMDHQEVRQGHLDRPDLIQDFELLYQVPRRWNPENVEVSLRSRNFEESRNRENSGGSNREKLGSYFVPR